jgi:hypothetical protein
VGAADIEAVLAFAFYSLYSILAFGAQAFDLVRRFPRSWNRRNVCIVSVDTLRVNPTAEEIFAAQCKSVEETFCGKVCGMIRRDRVVRSAGRPLTICHSESPKAAKNLFFSPRRDYERKIF